VSTEEYSSVHEAGGLQRAECGAIRLLRILLYAIFFLSGGSALLFETLWFHQAGLAFGNSVWASSVVLSSFMIGP
jgi:spermidine synthase